AEGERDARHAGCGRRRLGGALVLRVGVAVAFAIALTPAAGEGASCEDLRTVAIPNAEVTLAVPVPAGTFRRPNVQTEAAPAAARFAALPTFCRVTATLRPTADSDIKIEVWMPAEGWNGKFLGVGNGSWAGVV